MNTILKYSCIVSAVMLLSACDDMDLLSGKGKFYYSNPSENTITFTLDGKDYDVLPDDKGVVLLSSGLHQLKSDEGHVTDFFVFENNSGGIINPNNFVYYTLSEVYAVDGQEDKFKPASYPITINGPELELPARSSNATLIDTNIFRCSYPVGESFPDSITLYDDKLDGNIKSKCFDKQELVTYLDNEYGQSLLQDPASHKTLDSINMLFMYEVPTVIFDNPDVQVKAEKLIQLVTLLKNTDDVDIHKELNQEFHHAITELVLEQSRSASSSSVAENIKYNNFIQEINILRENGIWLKE
ncbi:hypothetical protein ACLI07_06010 [Providencia huaxiensis]|uniref:hypothetical protein n=1 Tax=Providencia TaxID=586 RepID=UPI00234B8327|nr:hypothetical protein [Providencia sp. PROV076]